MNYLMRSKEIEAKQENKLLYRNSAVFKLFMSVIPEEKDKTKEKDINLKKEEDIKDNNKEIKDKINSPILKNNSKEKVYNLFR